MTHVRGREPVGICQGPGQGGDDYPIVYPSDDITQLLADLYLAYEDRTGSYVLPFHIEWLYGFGTDVVAVPITPAHDHDMLIVDNEGTTVFDTLLATYSEKDWDSRLKILQWVSTEGEILRVVYHTEWSPEHTARTYDEYIEPTSAQLDGRTLLHLPRRVKSIQVDATNLTGKSTVYLYNGANTELVVGDSESTDGGTRTTEITISAEPNSGTGRFPQGCEDSPGPAITRINSVEPDENGEFKLDATGCHRLEIPRKGTSSGQTIKLYNHELQLFNSCAPCCDCDDYIAVYEAIRKLNTRFSAMIVETQETRDLYHANRDRFKSFISCTTNDRVRAVIEPFCPPGQLGIAAGYCNNTDECIRGLIVHFTFAEYTNATGCTEHDVKGYGSESEPFAVNTTATFKQIMPGSTFIQGEMEKALVTDNKGGSGNKFKSYRLGGAWPHYWAKWASVNPGSMAAVTFRLEFAEPKTTGERVEMLIHPFQVGPTAVLNNDSMVPGYSLKTGPVLTPEEMFLTTCPIYRTAALLSEC